MHDGDTPRGRDGEAALSRVGVPLGHDDERSLGRDDGTSVSRAGVPLGHDGENALGRDGEAPPVLGGDVERRREAQPMLDIDTSEREAG